MTGQRVLPRRTLLILDEVQSTERALASLKYFAEEAPELHVAAAGSLHEEAIRLYREYLVLGALAENFVAQQFVSQGRPLYYWTSRSTAEVDFVLPEGSRTYGVEVKKGEHTRSRSLSVFRDQEHPDGLIRLSLKNFGRENGIRAVPLYAIFCLEDGLEGA